MPREIYLPIEMDQRLFAPDSGNDQRGHQGPIPPRRVVGLTDGRSESIGGQGGVMQEQSTQREIETNPEAIAEDRFRAAAEQKVAEIAEICCIDGRRKKESVNVPAGDAGIIAVKISTAEDLTGTVFTPEMVQKVVDGDIEQNGGVYLHSDMHAAQKMAHNLAAVEDLPEAVVARAAQVDADQWIVELINDPARVLDEMGVSDTRATQDAVLDLMVKYLGCGHLAQMNSRSGEYDARQGLVGDVVKAIVRAKWAGKNVDIEFLPGDHGELLVAQYTKEGLTSDDTVKVVVPDQDGQPLFPLYPQVAEMRYASGLEGLRAVLAGVQADSSALTESEFVLAATAKAGKQAGLTMPALAKTLQKNGTLPDGIIPVVAVTEHQNGSITAVRGGQFQA